MRGKKTCGNEDLLGWWLRLRLFASLRVTEKSRVIEKISKWQVSIIVAKKYQNGRKKYQSNWN